jgi:hypothetical protein
VSAQTIVSALLLITALITVHSVIPTNAIDTDNMYASTHSPSKLLDVSTLHVSYIYSIDVKKLPEDDLKEIETCRCFDGVYEEIYVTSTYSACVCCT